MDEFVRQFRAKYPGAYDDMTGPEILRAVHRRYYDDMTYGEFVARLEEVHGKSDSGPTRPLPFNNLPPLVGGTLDAAVAFGTGAGLGIPLLSQDTRGYVGELMDRAPGATLAAGGAGALATGTLAAKGIPAAMHTLRPPAATPRTNPMLPPRPPPSAARPRLSPVRDLLLRRLLPGGLLVDYLRQRLGGN